MFTVMEHQVVVLIMKAIANPTPIMDMEVQRSDLVIKQSTPLYLFTVPLNDLLLIIMVIPTMRSLIVM